jgi:hypothetical protein
MQLLICRLSSSFICHQKRRVQISSFQLFSPQCASHLWFVLQQILMSVHTQIYTNALVSVLTRKDPMIAFVQLAPLATPRNHMDASKTEKIFQVTRSSNNCSFNCCNVTF